MISPLTLVTLSSLAVAALAGDVIPMYRHSDFDHVQAAKLDSNRWREHAFAQGGNNVVEPLTNTVFSYMCDLQLGTPPQKTTVVVDTGSTVFWVASSECTEAACGKPKDYFNPSKSSSFKKLKGPFQVRYGSGSVSGNWGRDIIRLSPKLSFPGIIGVANKASGILSATTDGIMGLRPPQPKSQGEVPTIVDELRTAKLTKRRILSVYFHPMEKSKTISTNGQMTIGSVDTANVKGPITYFPITKNMPAGRYWGFDHTGILIGTKVLQSRGSGILDTGTTLILLDTKIGQKLFNSIKGAKLDSQTGLYSYPCASLKKLPSFTIIIGGRKFTLTAEEYTAPSALMEDLGLPKGSKTCESWLSFGDTGLDIILGQKFLEYYVSVYNSDQLTMGLGEAKDRLSRNAHV